MRLDGEWLRNGATQRVFQVLADAGYQALFVGGCVRNALLQEPVVDIDMATDATPETVSVIAKDAGFKLVPTGIDHGTVTVVANGRPHEITTFRKDVSTDGRRATVTFSNDIADDARRRDFTMNALYARADGTVVDPLGGLGDALARRVRFIEDAERRIREDYLRILRYFRFVAWYGDPAHGHDPEALAAIAANLDGLKSLSAERVTDELRKLLAAPDPAPTMAVMAQTGVLTAVLPGAEVGALAVLVHLEGDAGAPPDPIRRLAALAAPDQVRHLRLSRAEHRQLTVLRREASSVKSAAELGFRFGAATALDTVLLRAALLENRLPPDLSDQIEQGAAARFPVSAQDLIPAYTGPSLGERLAELEARWIASGFTATKSDLLDGA